MNELIFFINKAVIAGGIIGSVYALGAVGVTLVFAILRFAHFAHGDLMTLGAFISFVLVLLFPDAGTAIGLPAGFVVLPLAMALTALMAWCIDSAFYRPLREKGVRPVVMVIASIGVTLMIQGVIRLLAGTGTRDFFSAETKDIFRIAPPSDLADRPVIFTEPQILLILFTVAAVIALHLFLSRSRLGKAMRAMSDNADLARISGIRTDLVVMVAWMMAGALAAAGGTLLSLDVMLKPDMSFNLLLPIFTATIVGGVGRPFGAIAGGFVIGFAETLAVFNWAVLLRPLERAFPDFITAPANLAFVASEYKLTVPFVILLLVLIWRPTGIFKGRVIQ